MKQKMIFIMSALLLLAVFVGGAIFFSSKKAEREAAAAAQNRESLVRFHAPTLGNAGAPVQIVEFFDPACGTCRDFYPLVKNLMAANPGKIQLIVRYAPLHPGSDQVVKALEAARRQGRFWQALEALFASQDQWVLNHTARPELAFAQLERLGLDMGRLRDDMNAPEVARVVAQDVADGKTLNVAATPEYFVNGKPLPSFGYEQLRRLVQDELASAKAG